MLVSFIGLNWLFRGSRWYPAVSCDFQAYRLEMFSYVTKIGRTYIITIATKLVLCKGKSLCETWSRHALLNVSLRVRST